MHKRVLAAPARTQRCVVPLVLAELPAQREHGAEALRERKLEIGSGRRRGARLWAHSPVSLAKGDAAPRQYCGVSKPLSWWEAFTRWGWHMPYAEGRVFFDADSHVMELPEFLRSHADPGMRDRIPPLSVSSGGHMGVRIQEFAAAGGHSAERVAELSRNVIAGAKNYEALGAFNPSERTQALDLLGFHAQWVFASFSPGQVFWITDIDARFAACRAHNRAMAEFCAEDPRLLAVALLSLEDPVLAAQELDAALDLGCRGVWIPASPCGGRSPGHSDFDPIWARLADAGVPFLLHVGGQDIQIRNEYMNTGRPEPTDWLGGAENVRSKDMTVLHHAAEEFLSVMVLDGVLERHRNLRGGAIELGATWVPGFVRRLDHAATLWARSEPELRAFTGRRPSRYGSNSRLRRSRSRTSVRLFAILRPSCTCSRRITRTSKGAAIRSVGLRRVSVTSRSRLGNCSTPTTSRNFYPRSGNSALSAERSVAVDIASQAASIGRGGLIATQVVPQRVTMGLQTSPSELLAPFRFMESDIFMPRAAALSALIVLAGSSVSTW